MKLFGCILKIKTPPHLYSHYVFCNLRLALHKSVRTRFKFAAREETGDKRKLLTRASSQQRTGRFPWDLYKMPATCQTSEFYVSLRTKRSPGILMALVTPLNSMGTLIGTSAKRVYKANIRKFLVTIRIFLHIIRNTL